MKKIIDLTFGELIMMVENKLQKICKDGVSIVNISTPNEFEWGNGDTDDEIHVEFFLDSDKDENLQVWQLIWSRKDICFSTLRDENQ